MRNLAILATLLLAGSAAGQGDWGDYGGFETNQNGCGSEINSSRGRELSYETGCVRGDQNGGTVEGFEVVFEVGREVRFLAEGGRVSGSQAGGSVTGFEYTLDILQIVEFRDDGDGKFIPDKDEILHQDPFSDAGWSDIRSSSPAGGGVAFEADYRMQQGGTFTIRGKATGGSYSEAGVKVTPFDTKIDFVFQDYGYSADDSQIALVLHVVSEGGSVQGSGRFTGSAPVVQGSERGLAGGDGRSFIYFTWAKTAEVDGTAKAVRDHVEILHQESESIQGGGGSVQGYEAEAGITLAYARGDSIVHDPRLGVQFNVKKDSPGPGAIVPVLGLLALAAVARRR